MGIEELALEGVNLFDTIGVDFQPASGEHRIVGGVLERRQALVAKGAVVQRPLWASTSTKDPTYPDTLYVDTLIEWASVLPDGATRSAARTGFRSPDPWLEPDEVGRQGA